MSASNRMGVAIGMAKAIKNLLLRACPPKLEQGKWTKTPPSYDCILAACLPNMIIKQMLVIAGQRISVRVENFNGDWSALSFAESQSVRWSDSQELISDAFYLTRIRIAV